MGKNEIQEVTPQKKHGLKISRGNTTLEFSPEQTKQICNDIKELGNQFISQTTELTLQGFEAELAAYYGRLDVYIEQQAKYSEDRKKILQEMDGVTDFWMKKMDEAENSEKWERAKESYKAVVTLNTKRYLEVLKAQSESESVPDTPNIFGNFFRGIFNRK